MGCKGERKSGGGEGCRSRSSEIMREGREVGGDANQADGDNGERRHGWFINDLGGKSGKGFVMMGCTGDRKEVWGEGWGLKGRRQCGRKGRTKAMSTSQTETRQRGRKGRR
ncbi:hypothetical protein NMG60_11015602 [Bertholletia excelsa]